MRFIADMSTNMTAHQNEDRCQCACRYHAYIEAKMAEIEKTFTYQMQETQESIDEVIAALERRQMDTVMKILDRQSSAYFMQLGMLLNFLGLAVSTLIPGDYALSMAAIVRKTTRYKSTKDVAHEFLIIAMLLQQPAYGTPCLTDRGGTKHNGSLSPFPSTPPATSGSNGSCGSIFAVVNADDRVYVPLSSNSSRLARLASTRSVHWIGRM
ncbi:hypothetical protein PILCRDRAFT_15459 [Piloderma croceum F 1598]|uniref:Uncharacterized protein n=1 Tax=Piloderma croceum (strain F 1598) TaxID=765440 RepID=A0A0C3EKN4_PILCF|nr:hypothetical protein PILCRDRAFT_15459 [Piloderma croceum F 1598]